MVSRMEDETSGSAAFADGNLDLVRAGRVSEGGFGTVYGEKSVWQAIRAQYACQLRGAWGPISRPFIMKSIRSFQEEKQM